MRRSSMAAAGFILLFAQALAAQNAAVGVLASNGVKGVMEEIVPQCERTVGHPLAMQFNTAAFLKERIEAGDAFDVALLTSEAIAGLSKEGKIAEGTRADISRVGIGIGIRKGAARPDISTPEAVKRVLLNAKSITYTPNGASAIWIGKMFEGLGIAEQLKAKIVPLQGADLTTASVAEGRTELVITLISEILTAPGIELLGPLPAQFQHYIGFAAGVSASAKNAAAASKVIQCFIGPAAAPAFKAKGMEPR